MSNLHIGFNAANAFALSTDGYALAENAQPCTGIALDGEGESALSIGVKTQTEKGFSVQYNVKENAAVLRTFVQTFDGINAVAQYTQVQGTDEKPHNVYAVAAANVRNVCFDGENIKERLSDGSIQIHYCKSKWQGEAQWRCATPETLGLYMATNHAFENASFRLESVSSWTTDGYFPIVIIEDKKKKECWFFEVEADGSWIIEMSVQGGWHAKSLSVKMGGADERLGFCKKLEKGQTYTTCTCCYGVVKGGFDQAVKELIKYKRATSLVEGGSPLTFNDYMNCNWAQESTARLVPLIDKAAELGAETFCIDDGWQGVQGIWYPADEKFDGGLQAILDYIKSKGMTAGVWFEFETVPYKLAEMLGSDDIFQKRNGETVAPHRPLANMQSQVLLDYLNERVDALYNMGVRFIKNDHNNHESIGTDMYGTSAAEGLSENQKAFWKFIDGIIARHPDLIVENCGSGGMRADWGALKHCHIQSTSDQEDYVSYTSIAAGSLALMPPEKAGIWCYPYPLLYPKMGNVTLEESLLQSCKNGEQTVYNVVNGILGALYVSGRIEQMDKYNTALMKEGMALYKQIYPFIKTGYPIYPMGMIPISYRGGYAFGLTDESGKEILLAVFNIRESGRQVCVDLQKYGMHTCEKIYPKYMGDCTYTYEDGKLVCDFVNGFSARLFRLK